MTSRVEKQKNKKQDNLENNKDKAVNEKAKYTAVKSMQKEDNDNLKNKKEEENNPLSIEFNSSNLLNALIYSEILGKPKSRRRGGWK